VGSYNLQWQMREQEPKTNGTCDISVVVTMELTEEEVKQIKADGKEYEAHDWVGRALWACLCGCVSLSSFAYPLPFSSQSIYEHCK